MYLKQLRSLGLLLIATLFGHPQAQANPDCPDELVIAVPKLAPYVQVTPSGETAGEDIDFLLQVSNRSGCKMSFKVMPFKRGMLSLKEGSVDMIIFASYKEERTKFGQYSLPYRWETQLISARNAFGNLSEIKSLKDMIRRGFIVGGIRGAYHGPDFQKHYVEGPGKELKRDITNYEKAISLMRLGRIDGLVSDSGILRHLSLSTGYTDWQFLEFPVFQNKVHFLLRKGITKETIQALNMGITDTVGNPVYNQIYQPENRLSISDVTS